MSLPPFDPAAFIFDRSATELIPVAVSACLAGEAVRYDGSDRYQPAIDLWLRQHLQLQPICPEAGANLGVPRPPVQLVASARGAIKARGRDDASLDVTDALQKFAQRSSSDLLTTGLCGYLWKSRSPSCGWGSTPLYRNGLEIGKTSGLQAAEVSRQLPWLAMAEEQEVDDKEGAWHFVWRCRLVFDVLSVAAGDLTQALRHYQPLHRQLPAQQQRAMEIALDRGSAHDYLAAMMAACRHLPARRLRLWRDG